MKDGAVFFLYGHGSMSDHTYFSLNTTIRHKKLRNSMTFLYPENVSVGWQTLYDCPFNMFFLNGSYNEYKSIVYSYSNYRCVFGTINEHFLSSAKYIGDYKLNPHC